MNPNKKITQKEVINYKWHKNDWLSRTELFISKKATTIFNTLVKLMTR